MTLPGFYLTEEELSLNIPRESDLIAALIGPASKGAINVLTDIATEPDLVAAFGRPINHEYAVRAGVRFLRKGNRLKFIRVAGSLLSYASRVFYAGGTKVLTVSAAVPGSWANDGYITIGLTQNSTTSFNIQVYENGKALVSENWRNLTNGDAETKINGISTYITVDVESGVGTTAPDETRSVLTGGLTPYALSGGDDGAFASTRSEDSSTGGIAGKRFYGLTDSVPGSRTWHNLHTITAADAGLTIYRGTLLMPVQPGGFYIRVQTGGAAWAELTDDEDDVLVSGMVYGGVGLLRDTTNTHKGFINYRTGQWGVLLVGGPTGFLGGSIDAIYLRGRSEAIGTTVTGQTAYSGSIASPDICPGAATVARVQIQVPMADTICTDSGILAAQHDSADANCQVMDGYIIPGTVVVIAPTATGFQTVYDDGFGGWRTAVNGGGAAVVGTLNYRTGDWDITFGANVPANSPITATYTLAITDMGGNALAGDDGIYSGTELVCTNATGGAPQIDSADANCSNMDYVPVEPGSARFVCSSVGMGLLPETVFDDGLGGLCTLRRGVPGAVDVVGTINYTTGAWDITFSANVNAGATITASYVSDPASENVRALRGSRLDYTDPAAGNSYLGLNHLNYVSGAFAFTLAFDVNENVVNNGTIYSVYQHGELAGWGDGTETEFASTIADAPLRYQSDRALAFQGGDLAAPGAGTTQMAFAVAGTPDYWDQNTAGGAAANPIDFASGENIVNWAAAPYRAEAVFIVAEEVVGHVTCIWTGDIGNERSTIADGMYCILSASTTDPTKLRFRVMFNDGSGSTAVEEWDLIDDFADLVATVNATDGTGSNVVNIEDMGTGTEPDVAASQNLGLDGAFTNSDIIGAKSGSTYTGLQLLTNTDTVAVDVIASPGQWHRQVQAAGILLSETEGRRALWLYSIPDFTPADQMSLSLPGVLSDDLAQDASDFVDGTYNAAIAGGVARPTVLVPYPPLAAVNSSYSCVHAFYLNYYDQYSQIDVWEPPIGDFAQLIAKTDKDQERWYPVAGLKRGMFQDVNTIRYSPDVADRTLMYEFDGTTQHVVNPIRYKVGEGIFCDGQRTMLRGSTVQARDRINVRLLLNKLGNLLEIANMRYEFDLNDPILWRQIEATGRQIVIPIIARRGLEDARLICDSTTNTPAVIAANECRARLMIQVTKAAEAIMYDVIIVPSGVSFDEVIF